VAQSAENCQKKTQMEGSNMYLPGVGEKTAVVMTTDICNRFVQLSVAASLWS